MRWICASVLRLTLPPQRVNLCFHSSSATQPLSSPLTLSHSPPSYLSHSPPSYLSHSLYCSPSLSLATPLAFTLQPCLASPSPSLLLVALFAYASAETIVTDSVGNGVSLPTTGGLAMNYITVLNSQVSTSPYYLYVSLNNGNSDSPNGAIAGEHESFFFNTTGAGQMNSSDIAFGNATLIQQGYSATFQHGGVDGQYVSNSTNPMTATGMYTFKFNIPALSTLTLNLTYTNSGPNPLPIVEFHPDHHLQPAHHHW